MVNIHVEYVPSCLNNRNLLSFIQDSHIAHQMVQSLLLLHLTITRAFVTNYKMKHS